MRYFGEIDFELFYNGQINDIVCLMRVIWDIRFKFFCFVFGCCCISGMDLVY